MTRHHENLQPSWRKPVGVGLIMLIIIGWAMLVVSALDWFGPMPVLFSVIVYAIAGVAWILPLRPILIWIETGRWR